MTKPIDLVLAGGGVKGIGLVGAVVKLMDAGYRAYRVAGIVGGFASSARVAAAAARDDQMTGAASQRPCAQHRLPQVPDRGLVERVPLLGPSLAILQGSGIYRGDYAQTSSRGQLEDLGVRTFGDLALDDDELPAGAAATGWW